MADDLIIDFLLKLNDVTIILSSVYIPPSTPNVMVQRWDRLGEFVEDLQARFSDIPIVLLMDNFNARLGNNDYTFFCKLFSS